MRLLVIFKAKQNKRLIWFDLLLTYTLVITVKMFAQKKLCGKGESGIAERRRLRQKNNSL